MQECFLTVNQWKKEIKTALPLFKDNKNVWYVDCPCSFDIETSSYKNSMGEKRCTMYIAMIGINGHYTKVRTYFDLLNIFNFIKDTFPNIKFIIYIQNLAYEFQFIRKWLNVTKFFAVKDRKPLYFESDNIIFKCSYLLSGLSLEKMGESVGVYKQVGKLDYKKIRHSKTPLTHSEELYCLYDLIVLDRYIEKEREKYSHICYIPYTKTGKVRKHIKNVCFYGGKKSHKKSGLQYSIYRRKMKDLTLTVNSYNQLKKAFQGGMTHSNPYNTHKKIYNVWSFDETSAYPAVMLRYQYPMSKPRKYIPENLTDFHKTIKRHCAVFTIKIEGLEPKLFYDFPISLSKCEKIENYTISNGRIMTADYLITTITEQDYYIYKAFYKWDKISIKNMYIFNKSNLPVEFLNAMLDLYQQKTELKGVEGKEDLYMNTKEMINSFFGMCVTDICRECIEYDNNNGWCVSSGDIHTDIEKYNNDKMRYLYYAWGVWITAYNRRVLFDAIIELKEDYIYSDTDSVKFKNYEKHKEYFERTNKEILRVNKAVCEVLGIDYNKTIPKTIKGVEKPLGVWENEGMYQIFKTCGAKRYMVLKDFKLSFTVAGCSKVKAIPYLINNYGKYKAFDVFGDNMYIPPEHTSKMTHTYIDDGFTEELTDYLGNTTIVEEKSFIHLEPCDFHMSMSKEFLYFLQGLKCDDL